MVTYRRLQGLGKAFRNLFRRKDPLDERWLNGRALISEPRILQVLRHGIVEDYVSNGSLRLKFYKVELGPGKKASSLLEYLGNMAPETPLWDAFVAAEHIGMVKLHEINARDG